MKYNLRTLFIAALLVSAPVLIFAQVPPLPGDTPPAGTEVGGAGAPIGNGTFILLTLAAAYAYRKISKAREVKEEVTE